MANTKVTGDLIASGTITADNLVSGTLDALLNNYLTTNTYATQGYVTTAVNDLIDAAPASLDTLNELAAALNDDANFATTVTNSLATKLNLSGGTLTGALTVNGDITSSANEGKLILNSTATNGKQYQLISIDTGNLGLYDGTAYRLWVNGNGNVGIGTSNAAEILEISKNDIVSGGSRIRITNSHNGSDWGIDTIFGGIDFYSSDNSNQGVVAGIDIIQDVINATQPRDVAIAFKTRRGATQSDASERVRISAEGNLGIGTSSPDELLHIFNSSGDANLKIDSTSTGGDARLMMKANSSGVSQIRFQDEADANVGLLTYAHSDNSMQFRTNDSERMRIDSSGRVGIGTTSPNQLLEISKNGSPVIRLNSSKTTYGSAGDSIGRIEWRGSSAAGNGAGIKAAIDTSATTTTQRDFDLLFKTSSNVGSGEPETRMTITADGNVGIGEQNPTNPLTLYKNASQGNPSSHTPANATLKIEDQANTMYLDGNSIIATGSAAFTFGNTQAADMLFYTDAEERMRITSGGNVGIGTTSPSAKLDVDGHLAIANGSQINLTHSLNSNNLWYGMRYSSDEVQIYTYDASNRSITFNTANGTNVLSGQLMKIQADGKVGIGDNDPDYRLVVSGTGTERVRVGSTNNTTAGVYFTVKSAGSLVGNGTIATQNNGDMRFFTGTNSESEKMRLLAGGGLTFNGDTAAANALDDYEEGTWTPVVTATGTNPTVNYIYKQARYTKIGDAVSIFVSIRFDVTAAGSGSLNVSLPFTAATFNFNYQHARTGYYPSGYAEDIDMVGAVWGQANLRLYTSINATATSAAITGDRAFHVNMTYFV